MAAVRWNVLFRCISHHAKIEPQAVNIILAKSSAERILEIEERRKGAFDRVRKPPSEARVD